MYKHISEWVVFPSSRLLLDRDRHTHHSVNGRVANFLFLLHVHFNGHQHWMNVKLEGNHAINFQQCRKVRRVPLHGRDTGRVHFLVHEYAHPNENDHRRAHYHRHTGNCPDIGRNNIFRKSLMLLCFRVNSESYFMFFGLPSHIIGHIQTPNMMSQ